MQEEPTSQGIISRDDLAELSVLFDRFEFALDPTSDDCKLAEVEFENEVERLYRDKVVQNFSGVSLMQFRCHIRGLCRKFLKRN
jgi:hypothetical protein